MGLMNISGLNALIEALREGQPLNRIWIGSTRRGPKIDLIKSLCRRQGVVFQIVPDEAIRRKAGMKNQGVFAEVSPVPFRPLEKILEINRRGLIVLLDGIEDVGNLGAIIRTAAAVEADAVVVAARRSAPLTETVWQTSAGAVAKIPIVQSANLVREIERLKKAGFWVYGTAAEAGTIYWECDFTVPTAFIFGSEQRGLSPLLKKKADGLLRIPIAAAVESLNVAAAAAAVLFEARRQKLA